jgi:EAL domain-containing protein (putative c-di-GMP-specific phosphodiesterase class I)
MLLLSQVCEQLQSWGGLAATPVPIAVNVSPLQLLDPGFPQLVHNTLKRYGVPAELITLEVTETAALGNMELACSQLTQLQALGLKVAMDDFGTGFSSLDMLRTLPLSVVKIDRSLIAPMPAPEAVAVVRAICQLAAALKLRVVAEGVETEAQAQAARQAGCHEIQGYLYAKPLSPELALQWLMAGTRPIC